MKGGLIAILKGVGVFPILYAVYIVVLNLYDSSVRYDNNYHYVLWAVMYLIAGYAAGSSYPSNPLKIALLVGVIITAIFLAFLSVVAGVDISSLGFISFTGVLTCSIGGLIAKYRRQDL